MENLKIRYDVLLKALEMLNIMLEFYVKKLDELDINDHNAVINIAGLRDSVIQRFEYCYELTWKYLATFFATQA